MSSPQAIRPGSSGVVGEHAVVSAGAAVILVRLLADWRRDLVRLGVHPAAVAELEQAVDALRETARGSLTPSESAKGQEKPAGAGSAQWLTTEQVAAHIDRTPARVRQLLAEGRIEGQKVGRQWRYPPEVIAQAMAEIHE